MTIELSPEEVKRLERQLTVDLAFDVFDAKSKRILTNIKRKLVC